MSGRKKSAVINNKGSSRLITALLAGQARALNSYEKSYAAIMKEKDFTVKWDNEYLYLKKKNGTGRTFKRSRKDFKRDK